MKEVGWYCIITGSLLLLCVCIRSPSVEHYILCFLTCLTAVLIYRVAKDGWL